MWYFCANKSMEKCYLLISEKFLFWSFRKWEIRPFLSQKSDGKIIFTGYWKFLFWTFRWWEIRPFLSQDVDGKMIFSGYWEVLVSNFSVMGNTVFVQPKSWWKDGIYLVFFSFTWYSRTWEIWFFVQWQVWSYLPLAKNWPETPCIKPKPLWNKTQWCFEMWLRFCVKS